MTTIARSEWETIRNEFASFFAGAGTVTTEPTELVFDGGPTIATSLAIRSDGTSRSFMPLHDLEARWDRITFDRTADEVILETDAMAYVYRVPPALRRA